MGLRMKNTLYKTVIAAAIATTMATLAQVVQAQISVAIDLAPPPLPVYAQPAIPSDGYLWTPGYWGWNANDNDYYWTPGTWVLAPYEGALWTPGYWGFEGNRYTWNNGYWGQHIGYYGGINYGFGYTGVGYQGGYWDHGNFNYNRNVNNVSNTRITHIYTSNVIVNERSHVSFNGGKGGVQMTASKNDQLINSMPHNHATPAQAQHEAEASAKPDLRLSANHGAPKIAATPEPSSFNSPKVEPTRADANKNSRPAAPARSQPAPSHQKQQDSPRPVQQQHPQPSQQQHPQPSQQPAHEPPRPAQNNHAPASEEQRKEK